MVGVYADKRHEEAPFLFWMRLVDPTGMTVLRNIASRQIFLPGMRLLPVKINGKFDVV